MIRLLRALVGGKRRDAAPVLVTVNLPDPARPRRGRAPGRLKGNGGL